MKTALASAFLAASLVAAPGVAAPLTVAFATLSNAQLVTAPAGVNGRIDSAKTIVHGVFGDIDAAVLPDLAPDALDVDALYSYEVVASLNAEGFEPLSGALSAFGPATLGEVVVSGVNTLEGLLVQIGGVDFDDLDSLSATGSGTYDIPEINLPGLPALGPEQNVDLEWDVSGVSLDLQSVKMSGAFYLGVGSDLADELTRYFDIDALPNRVSFDADIRVIATPYETMAPVPLPAGFLLLVSGLTVLGLRAARR